MVHSQRTLYSYDTWIKWEVWLISSNAWYKPHALRSIDQIAQTNIWRMSIFGEIEIGTGMKKTIFNIAS